MNNNENMNDLIKKAQKMIENNQIPPEIKEFAQKLSNKEHPTQSNSSKTSNNTLENFQTNNESDNLQKMIQMATAVSNQTSDDDMSKLLFALKPYLRNEKKEKIDDYIKLIKMGKIAKLIEKMNNNTT